MKEPRLGFYQDALRYKRLWNVFLELMKILERSGITSINTNAIVMLVERLNKENGTLEVTIGANTDLGIEDKNHDVMEGVPWISSKK